MRLSFTLILAVTLFVVGCETAGWIHYHNDQTGESWEVHNPPKAQAPATLTRGENGKMDASVSPPLKEDTAIKQLWVVPVIGAGLMVLGVGTLILRGWFPSVPMAASIGSMATGALLIAAPKIVQEAWWLIAVMVAAVAVMYGISWWDNHRKLKGTA